MEHGIFFFFKKAVAFIASPLTAVLCLVVVFVFLSWLLKKQWYMRTVVGGLLAVYVMATPLFSVLLISPLEDIPDVFDPTSYDPEMQAIVVLACWHIEREDFPLVSQYGECSLRRNTHGILLQKASGLPLYFTGGMSAGRQISESRFNQELALRMGVPPWMTHVVPGAIDTHSEAKTLKKFLPAEKIVLVTTASHMKRARQYFEHYGFEVSPSPTDHRNYFSSVDFGNPTAYLPTTRSLRRTELAIYEYLGLLSQKWFELI